MNLEYYRNFITIVDTGSLSKAAELLHIAQPALSRQLHIMEQEYGLPLLESGRGSHKLRLTDGGWIFYRQARQLCLLEEETRRQMESCKNGTEGTLRISLSPSRVPFFINRYVRPFMKKYPEVRYELHEAQGDELMDQVRRGLSEIGIANAMVPDLSLFRILYQRKEDFIAAIPESRAVKFPGSSIFLSDLSGERIVTTRTLAGFFDETAKKEDLHLDLFALTDTRSTALRFAEENLSIALIPWESMEALPIGVRAFSLKGLDRSAMKTIFCLREKTLSPAMQKFLEVYEEELHQLPLSEE